MNKKKVNLKKTRSGFKSNFIQLLANFFYQSVAVVGYYLKFEYRCSTFIDEESIIAGYGKLNYDFKYPFPRWLILKVWGTTSWKNF